jgi:DNA-binding PadR family transcriptional regulator
MYSLTGEGRKVLAAQRTGWRMFVQAINRVARAER